MKTALPLACLVVLVTGCRDSRHAPATPPHTAAEQNARGSQLFAANCAKCHGDAGQGSEDAPPLVGKGALPLDPRPDQKLRKAKFHTAMDVASFVTQQMPPKASDRAKLTPEDYWAILAFALNANGVAVKEPVSPGKAASIVLHP
jgi:cytochrome c